MQVEKCYFLSNLPRQAVSNPESGRESNMFRVEILYFLGVKCLQMGDFGLRLRRSPAQLRCTLSARLSIIQREKPARSCSIFCSIALRPVARGNSQLSWLDAGCVRLLRPPIPDGYAGGAFPRS